MNKSQKKNYLKLSDEDLAKIEKAKASKKPVPIDEEHLFIAEFGKHYGYEGVRAILNNEIDYETASWLLVAARKIEAGQIYDMARAVYIGTGSVKTKKPSSTFQQMTSELIKQTKADNK